jgi:hypothetical protein
MRLRHDRARSRYSAAEVSLPRITLLVLKRRADAFDNPDYDGRGELVNGDWRAVPTRRIRATLAYG